jgi:hypothetical protein
MSNTTYTVWANNTGGSDSVTISITVNEPSASISYPGTPFEFTREMTYSVSPSTGGGVIDTWGISPDLPSGLSFNSGNGTISGTPTVNMSNTTYTVWAINSGGNTSITITIVVNEPQAVLTPSQTGSVLTSNVTMTDITFSNSGGNISNWSIHPPLPSGLNFDYGDGTISGTPDFNQSVDTYTIWANNSGGNVSANINIVILHPIDAVSYSSSYYNLTDGDATVISPNTIGAGVHTWEIDPSLPLGLGFDPSTGVISGTPLDNSSIDTYTITATNDNGSTSTNFTMVVVNPLTAISYPTTHYNATEGVGFILLPNLTGTEIIDWWLTTDSGQLPLSHFSIDSSNGTISGIPISGLANATYTVYGANDNGTVQFSISIWILEDNDGDGYSNAVDRFPLESSQWNDTDDDGYGDNQTLGSFEPDGCPSEWGNSSIDRFGCLDTDADGYSDPSDGWTWVNGSDNFTTIPSQWADQDGDGYGDNLSGNEPDMFQTNPTQWNDTDGDGYGDNYNFSLMNERDSMWPGELFTGAYQIDRFPLESSQWNDTDDDGYGDNQSGYQADACPEVSGNSTIPVYGCIDSDGDGVRDDDDDFPADPSRSRDTDGDDFDDGEDDCWDIAGNSTEDRTGCVDSDGDGYSDEDLNWSIEDGADALRYEPTQWNDTDDDGYGDNQIGFQPDACIEFYGNSTIDRWGCLDTDGDGVSDPDLNGDYGPVWTVLDGADAFPDNASATGDADGDGFDNGLDDCLTIYGNSTGFFSVDSTSGGKKGCPDSDGDGWADSEDEEPNDPQQITDTTPPPLSTIWNVVDEDENGGVLLVELSHSGSDWNVLDDSDRPVSIQVRYSTTVISDCSGVLVNGPTEDVSQSTGPPSVIKLENLTNEQEYHVCLFISDIRGNEFILGPNNATPTINEPPMYDGRLTNEIAYIGELWYLNLCDYFSDVETPCEELEVSSSTNRLGINSVNKSVSWRPTGTDASIMNITFTVCDSGLIPLCVASNPINIGVEEQPESSEGEDESGGYIVDLPFFGETEVSMDSIAGIVGSAFLGIVTILITVMRFRRSRSGKKRVSQIIKEIRITKNDNSLDDLLDEATRLYTKDKINTEDYSLIDGHIEKRKVVLMRESVASPQLSPPGASPSIDAKGEVRPDGYEWLEHPVGNGVWWYRVPGANSWGKWDG